MLGACTEKGDSSPLEILLAEKAQLQLTEALARDNRRPTVSAPLRTGSRFHSFRMCNIITITMRKLKTVY